MVGNFLLLMGRIGLQRMSVPFVRSTSARRARAHDPLDLIDGENDLRRRLVLAASSSMPTCDPGAALLVLHRGHPLGLKDVKAR
jgi:hypothetical protein